MIFPQILPRICPNIIPRIDETSSAATVEKFIMSWKTNNAGTSNSAQITLPLEASGTYNFTVSWGDNTTSIITAYNQAEVTHTYPIAGTYTVEITGTCYGFRFNNGGDKLKLLNISSWGTGFRLGNSNAYFRGCSNLTITATNRLDLTNTTTMLYMFLNCSSLTKIPSLDTPLYFNTSNVTTFEFMFGNCVLFTQDLTYLNTSSALSMAAMFSGCIAFNQPVSSFDTTNVTTMSEMFSGCTIFNQSVANFNVAKVTNMAFMFSACVAFNQSLAGWDIRLVTTMANMFVNNLAGLSKTNYDALLIAWAALVVPKSSVPFHAGTTKYTAGGAAAAARLVLTGTYLWSITDGGT